MPSKKFTVTHPDGTVSKRTSKNAEYTHAAVIVPATQESRTAAFNARAAEMEAEADRLDAAAEEGKTRLRDRRLGRAGDPDYFHSHEMDLLGTEVAYRSRGARGTYCSVSHRTNLNGEAEVTDPLGVEVRDSRTTYGTTWYRVDAAAHLIVTARAKASSLREGAIKTREEGQQPDTNGYGVVRWSRSADLAAKGISEFGEHADGYGRTMVVVPVDQA